ncbi:caspase family protein [Sulfurimonas sp.]|nr:caspase family protein [Sulfurimonas sp.]
MNKLLILFSILCISLDANTDRALKMMKSEQRVALVIGNNIYNSDRLTKLKNPINDAKAMKIKLRSLGFEVFYGENLSVRDMDKKLRSFNSKLRKGGVGLFFFAGHGVESQGKNYLMGKDSNLVDKLDIAYESLELNKVLDSMKNSGNRLNIVLLDACRNDPFSRSSGGGLAKVDNAKGMFIAYATSPGDVASDGSGKHGVFTEQILNNIDEEGIPIGRMFKKVKRGVYDKTQEQQRPWTHDDIIGDFFFRLPSNGSKSIQSTKIILNETKKVEETHDMSDIVVLDGLMWQDEPYVNKEVNAFSTNSKYGKVQDYEGSKKYCSNLKLAGYSDWYLPDIKKLKKIMDKNKTPKIKKEFNHVVTTGGYLSSSTNKNLSQTVWNADFSLADTFYYPKQNVSYVRCVRDENQIPEKKVKRTKRKKLEGTVVLDGLMWQDNKDTKTIRSDWKNSNIYCKSLTLSGHHDWRLPTKKELKKSHKKTGFSYIGSDSYWSSNIEIIGSTEFPWEVSSKNEEVSTPSSNNNHTRCVRNN